ncbi:hypothetical protein H4R18_005480 [Coemansia javaensis]|uniref:Uncharacterized protein n=1 Tax=Coemansia javaensis TaxID=2761396 RepID=A0A9W8H8Z6_9FUNG|nr:hypothetical protein H4R18_005480 [Coemansia javaensis]
MSNQVPEQHLALAAQWADAALAAALDAPAAAVRGRVDAVERGVGAALQQAAELEARHAVAAELLGLERAALRQQMDGLARQVDAVARLVDAVERNVAQMEDAMDRAESAVGLSLGGRLEQLARFLGRPGAAAGVPYLRQWAPRDQAIPSVVDYREYI